MGKLNFIYIEYNGFPYPVGIESDIKEIAAHFDKESIVAHGKYSLHTEYSYGKRKFDNALIKGFFGIVDAQKDGVPQLWKSTIWAEEFADFIIELTKDGDAPEIIEIHPPFNDYCDFNEFAERYYIFERKIHAAYPDVMIVIENRSGSIYKGGRFLIGKAEEIVELCKLIQDRGLNLGVVLDYPQLLTAERINTLKFNAEKYMNAIAKLENYRDVIKGVHIWGKKKSEKGRWVAHAGNLDTYFGNNMESKNTFLEGIFRICADGKPRFLVPEVNTGLSDLEAIIKDVLKYTEK